MERSNDMAEKTDQGKPTLDQRRARHAWDAVQQLKKLDKDKAKEYAGEAEKLPTRIMAAGLGQALAFLAAKAKAKDKKPNLKKLLDDLTGWVIQQRPMIAAKTDSLLGSVIHGNSDFLRRATDETLAYLQWLNRFAEAEGLADQEGGA
jgi:CRISPR-associated protein Cmr5